MLEACVGRRMTTTGGGTSNHAAHQLRRGHDSTISAIHAGGTCGRRLGNLERCLTFQAWDGDLFGHLVILRHSRTSNGATGRMILILLVVIILLGGLGEFDRNNIVQSLW